MRSRHRLSCVAQLSIVASRLQQSQQNLHEYEKEHRYSNEDYFEREQRMKSIENDLSNTVSNHDRLQRDHSLLKEELTKCQYDLEQMDKSDHSHKERVSRRRMETRTTMCVHLVDPIDGRSKDLQTEISIDWWLFQDDSSKGKLLLNACSIVALLIRMHFFGRHRRRANVGPMSLRDFTSRSVSCARTPINFVHWKNASNNRRKRSLTCEVNTKICSCKSWRWNLSLRRLICTYVNTNASGRRRATRTVIYAWRTNACAIRSTSFIELKASCMPRLTSKNSVWFSYEKNWSKSLLSYSFSLSYCSLFSNETQMKSEAQTLLERLKHSFDDTIHERDQLVKNINHANKKVIDVTEWLKKTSVCCLPCRSKNSTMTLMGTRTKAVSYSRRHRS